MARKSRVNKEPAAVVIDSGNTTVYKAGLYARLSNEESGKECLENQMKLLESYVEGQPDLVKTAAYQDFGFSGTNFERPGFERLMEDVKRGKVDCIVVKDLSRLGRNYIETGDYIEKVFPFLGIRFVSVNDHFDTLKTDGAVEMMVSLKNLINDIYAKDISRKTIGAFRAKQARGEYIGLVAPYGYLKSVEDKHKFVVDAETAPVVREIFDLYLGGMGTDAIARELDARGIDCPRKYRYRIGVTKSDRYLSSRWCRNAVQTILTNQAYLGHMVQGKVRQELCNHVEKQYVPEKDWVVVKGTHEPIISEDVFQRAQEEMNRRKEEERRRREQSRSAEHKEENYLRGYLRCSCCGRGYNLAQYMRSEGMSRYYYCRGYKTLRSAICTHNKTIPKAKAEKEVLGAVRKKAVQLEILVPEKMDRHVTECFIDKIIVGEENALDIRFLEDAEIRGRWEGK